jgi:hypothetical protein
VETDKGQFDGFQSLEVINDIAGISEAVFTIGDADSAAELDDLVKPGQPFRIYCNDRLRMVGRAEVNEVPCDASSGAVLQLTCRTKLSDARYASADPSIRIQNATLKEVIVQAYGALGLKESDFRFGEFADVNAITGKSPGKPLPFEPDKIQLLQARVQPPETYYELIERHLNRYQATQWDAADGKINFGRPDDEQKPLYRLICRRDDPQGNNLISSRRIRDWTEVPLGVAVVGQGWGHGKHRDRFKAIALDSDVAAVAGAKGGHFNRPVVVVNQQAKSGKEAERIAQRELSARIRRKDAWEFTTDGWTYWDGAESIGWATNTTVDVDVDHVAGASGRYLIVRTALRLDSGGAATTAITVVAPGVWVL